MAVYEKMPICDLRNITAECARQIERIEKVALLILPANADEETRVAIAAIPKTKIANILELSNDAQICTTNGVARITEADFGSEMKIHVINGIAIMESIPKDSKAVFSVNGIMIIKKDQKENMSGVNLIQLNGLNECLDFDSLKIIQNDLTIDSETIRWMKPKTGIVVAGELTFADDVIPEMLDEKNIVIICAGEIYCSKKLEPYLKATVMGSGEIFVNE